MSPSLRFLRPRRYWFAWPTLLSAALFWHFAISVGVWGQWFVLDLRNAEVTPDWLWEMLLPMVHVAAPAFLLCLLSGLLTLLAVQGRRVARRGSLYVLAAALSFFAIDTRFGRWQIHLFIATTEYWDAGGKSHVYFTWWWYNDRWLRDVSTD